MKRFFEDNSITGDADEIAATHVAYARCVACLRKLNDAGLAKLADTDNLTKGVVSIIGRAIWPSFPDEFIKAAKSIHEIYGSVCSAKEGDPEPLPQVVLRVAPEFAPVAECFGTRRSYTPAPSMSGSFCRTAMPSSLFAMCCGKCSLRSCTWVGLLFLS
jgi:hypothetical protein